MQEENHKYDILLNSIHTIKNASEKLFLDAQAHRSVHLLLMNK